jgi:hypothetical protein
VWWIWYECGIRSRRPRVCLGAAQHMHCVARKKSAAYQWHIGFTIHCQWRKLVLWNWVWSTVERHGLFLFGHGVRSALRYPYCITYLWDVGGYLISSAILRHRSILSFGVQHRQNNCIHHFSSKTYQHLQARESDPLQFSKSTTMHCK